MTDAPARLGAPTDAPHYTLTVKAAVARYEQAGIPRTPRRIQKYCARNDLDWKKVETEFGERYLISAKSVDRHIAQISDAQAAAGRARPRRGAPERPLEIKEIPVEVEAAPPGAQARLGAPDDHAKALERENKSLRNERDFLRSEMLVKNDQIKDLTERARETNYLIAGLQKMLTPLLNPAGERRDAGETGRSRASNRLSTAPRDAAVLRALYWDCTISWQSKQRKTRRAAGDAAERQALHGEHAFARCRRPFLP